MQERRQELQRRLRDEEMLERIKRRVAGGLEGKRAGTQSAGSSSHAAAMSCSTNLAQGIINASVCLHDMQARRSTYHQCRWARC